MQNIFQYDNVRNRVQLNVAEILLVKEFAKLVECKRNICKNDPKGELGLKAFKEFAYIYLALSWKSPYSDYSEQERHTEALNDSGITEEEFNDPDFRAACRKFKEIQESNRAIKLLKAAERTVDELILYFNNIDLQERDTVTGKYLNKTKDVMAEMSNVSKVLEELKTLEGIVKKELTETTTLRGNVTEDFDPGDF